MDNISVITLRRKYVIAVCILVSMMSTAAAVQVYRTTNESIKIPLSLLSTLRPEALALQNFTLVDHTGERFTLSQLKNKWSFIFPGYTYCPDICSNTLIELNKTNKLLSESIPNQIIQYIFLSIDPQRDDLQTLKKFVQNYSQSTIGVTGTAEQLTQLLQQLNAYAERTKHGNEHDYHFKHTTSILLIDPRGRLYASFAPLHRGSRIADQFIQLFQYYNQNV